MPRFNLHTLINHFNTAAVNEDAKGQNTRSRMTRQNNGRETIVPTPVAAVAVSVPEPAEPPSTARPGSHLSAIPQVGKCL